MSDRSNVYFTRNRRRKMEKELAEQEMERELARHQGVPEFQTKLTDVNDDCLEMIFMHLDFDDFINIVHTSRLLKPAAQTAFALKRAFNLNILSKSRGYHKLKISDCNVTVQDLKTSLRFLRCFGHTISKLSVGGTPGIMRLNGFKMIHHVNEYCLNSLVETTFRCLPAGAFQDLKHPLIKVESVTFQNSELDQKSKQLIQWFPQMNTLQLDNIQTHHDCIEVNIPGLQHLTVKGRETYSADRVMNVIRLNPQLLSLHLDVHEWVKVVKYANQVQLGLVNLRIDCQKDGIWSVAGVDVVNFNTLRKLEVDFCYFRNIPISFNRLEEFTWTTTWSWLGENFHGFLQRHPYLAKLSVVVINRGTWLNTLSHEHITKIIAALPLLEKINFDGTLIGINSLISLINNCKSLNECCLLYFGGFSVDHFKTFVSNEWQISIDGVRIRLERKN